MSQVLESAFITAKEVIELGEITPEIMDLDFSKIVESLRARLAEKLGEINESESEEEAENILQITVENLQIEAFIAGYLAAQNDQSGVVVPISVDTATDLVKSLLGSGGIKVVFTISE